MREAKRATKQKQPKATAKKPQGPINFWKWLAIILLALILGGGAYMGTQVLRTPSEAQTVTATKTDSAASVPIKMNRQQLNALAAYYLADLQKGQALKYKFVVRADAAYLLGTTKVLGQNVSFVITMQPSVISNGNISLKATKLSVGTMSLPISFVINYINNNYKIPKWVKLSAKHKTIDLYLNKLVGKHDVRYSVDKVDLTNNQFNFEMHIPKTD
ncbi:YpmS family protein [Lactiplantibacillus sp. WILCCON 0030]|uniref:YpmS family protein n=1 Tax=Lactiplantibacillus brownii TaxID=3069269 RepID=A0ABU1A911_9LACO|nr:YpmS family protein [Lactiplantibacillus brownii]MDQ7937424.1 YpmS family protein [Lactiplantibacillus brownii]